MTLAVETRALTKIYRGKVHALKALDLKVPQGCAFGLLGPNGAGKSTLVKTLLSIVAPTSGHAWLLGTDIASAEARRSVGYLPEGHRFPNYLTGRGVCQYFGKLSGLQGAELEKQVEEKLDLVGMREWGDTKIVRYSKGMNQRVGLAQAMLGNPKLVILDEPTDGVDPVGRHQIREVIQNLCKSGTTVLMNSHLLLEVEQICDQIAIMHHGKVLEQGSVDDIRKAVSADQRNLIVNFETGSPLTPQVREALGALGTCEFQSGTAFEITLPSSNEIDQAVDLLRQNQISIFAVRPRIVNLEQAFIDVISAQEDQHVGGTR